MSSTQASSSSTPNCQNILDKALKEYAKKTGEDLTTHPLTAEINGCISTDAILAVLQGKANELDQSRKSDERLAKWLTPTVNVLNALSATLGPGLGSVSYRKLPHHCALMSNFQVLPPINIIFSGISILLVVSFMV